MKQNLEAKVLLVDDNEAGRYVIARHLRLAGHEVFEAATGAEGLRLLEVEEPDVAVLDVHLPDISGLELCRKLKSNPQSAHLPVLHISATFVTSSDRVEGLESGADGYLCEPIDPKELLAYVKAMVRVRRAERRLQIEKDFSDATINSLPGLFYLLDKRGKLLRWNRNLEQITNCSAEEIARMHALDFIMEKDRPRAREAMELALTTGEAALELELETKTGQRIPYTFTGKRFVSGQRTYFVGTGLNISERRLAEEALRESEARFRQLAESLPQLVWTAQADGSVDYYNYRISEYAGAQRGVEGRWDWQPLIHPEDLASTLAAWNLALREGIRYQSEHRVRMADRSYRWHLSRAYPSRDAKGDIVKWFGTTTNIDDQKHAQQILEQKVQERTAKLREAISDLEHFSYTITHDMRAPLRAMRGFAAIMSEECQTCPTPARRDYLRRIDVAAGRMDMLIEDALDYSKIVQQELSLSPIDTHKLLEGIIESYPALQSPQAEIQITGAIPAALGNQAAMTQCFSNLLNNAVKFVPPGQVPQVRVWAEQRDTEEERDAEGMDVPHSSIHQSINPSIPPSNPPSLQSSSGPAGWVRIWVEDNGIGIPQHCHERIFAMFQRLNKNYEGTGIGLALVRKAVERMGGRVGLESELGRGSRFWVEFRPATMSAPQATRRNE